MQEPQSTGHIYIVPAHPYQQFYLTLPGNSTQLNIYAHTQTLNVQLIIISATRHGILLLLGLGLGHQGHASRAMEAVASVAF